MTINVQSIAWALAFLCFVLAGLRVQILPVDWNSLGFACVVVAVAFNFV